MTSQNPASEKSSSLPQWKKDLPMNLTWARVAICLPIVVSYYGLSPVVSGWTCALLFVLGALTDWADGYFARRFDAKSTYGQFMDPIADKILVSTVLVLLASEQRASPLLVILLLTRDIFIGGIRSVAAADRLIIDAKPTGKWKTALQMLAIPILLIHESSLPMLSIFNTEFTLQRVALWVLWLSTVLSLLSGWEYFQLYRKSQRK